MLNKNSDVMDVSAIRILLVEEDAVFRDLNSLILKSLGYDLVCCSSGADLYRELVAHSFDIVLLDADLSGDDSLVLTQQLRGMHRTKALGIILLGSDDRISARIKGLKSGADAYMRKPVSPQQIHAQIESLYRRISLNSDQPTALLWRFSATDWKLFAPSGVLIELTHLEAKLVHNLATHSRQPVSRREIISKALNQDPMIYDERRLEAVISRLPKKIAKRYFASQPIKVAHSVGYMFSDKVDIA